MIRGPGEWWGPVMPCKDRCKPSFLRTINISGKGQSGHCVFLPSETMNTWSAYKLQKNEEKKNAQKVRLCTQPYWVL